MKRLALFWLVCAAAGFAVAASVAVLLSVVLGGDGRSRPAASQTTVRALEMGPSPGHAAAPGDPQDVGHGRLMPW